MFHFDIPIHGCYQCYFWRWALPLCISWRFLAPEATSVNYCAADLQSGPLSAYERNNATNDNDQDRILLTVRQATGSVTCSPYFKAFCEEKGETCMKHLWVDGFRKNLIELPQLKPLYIFTETSTNASFPVSVLSLVRMMGSASKGGECCDICLLLSLHIAYFLLIF